MVKAKRRERDAALNKIRDDHIECELQKFDTKGNQHTDIPNYSNTSVKFKRDLDWSIDKCDLIRYHK